jgi:biotin operon repressor
MPADSIKAKWPDPLWRWGFIPVARAFLRNYRRLEPPITHFQAILLMNLIDYVWTEERPAYPSSDRLAEDLGESTARIEKALQQLEENGYVKRDFQGEKLLGYNIEGLYSNLRALIEEGKGKAWVGKRSS